MRGTVYYNPAIFKVPEGAVLGRIHEILPSDSFYHVKSQRAYSSKEEVITANISGTVCWWEGDKLMQGSSTGNWVFKPLIREPTFEVGIHWSDAYFFSRESAEKWSDQCGCRHDSATYEEDFGVYSVHFHHTENQECMRESTGTTGELTTSVF